MSIKFTPAALCGTLLALPLLAGCFSRGATAPVSAVANVDGDQPSIDAQPIDTSDETPKVDSHERMLATLQEIRKQTADHHPFLGNRALREAKAALEAAEKQPGVDPRELSPLHGAYGEELLRAGETEKAI